MGLSYTETRDILAELGPNPKRFLGQNFLVDGNIVNKSLELAKVGRGDRVVEVGPGLGTLTEALLQAEARVWAVEKDETLYKYVQESLTKRFPTLTLTLGDAVDLPRAELPDDQAEAGIKIVANLPSAISTPWMDAILSGPLPERMVLMLQREAADRYGAAHGSKSFGAISIFLQSAYAIAPGHAVSAACFHPKPDVDSFLLNLVRKEKPVLFSPEIKLLIRSLFQQRRKQIGSTLRSKAPMWVDRFMEQLTAAGLSAQVRAEAVPLEVWQRLAVHGQPSA